MSTSPTTPPLELDNHGDSSCVCSITSASTASRTDITSPSQSLRHHQSGYDAMVYHPEDPSETSVGYRVNGETRQTPYMYGGIYKQDDVVGRYLAHQAAQQSIIEGLQASGPHYVSPHAGYSFGSHQFERPCDSYAYSQTLRWYPDPERIRHLHTLHGLLPHIQPERKLNALSGPQIDIVEQSTGNVFCRAVSKKMLVLFLGRPTVSRFIHTISRKDNETWRGPPTQQSLQLPRNIASASAITILISWMIRACKHATMTTMKPVRVPTNLFAACSLAQTMELLSLRKDAYRMDLDISRQFANRPLFPVEIESLWRCLGETNRYVYAAIKALGSTVQRGGLSEELQSLATRCPELYARICDAGLNEQFRPQFGRAWFSNLSGVKAGMVVGGSHNDSFGNGAEAPDHLLLLSNDIPRSRDEAPLLPDACCHPQGTTTALDPSAAAFRPVSREDK